MRYQSIGFELATTAIWVIVLLISGLIDGVINIWAYRHAQTIESLFSWQFAVFVVAGTFVYMTSIGLFLAAMVGAPARPGFPFIWPVSVVFFTAVVAGVRGEIKLETWQWATGIVLVLLPLLFWSWVGEG